MRDFNFSNKPKISTKQKVTDAIEMFKLNKIQTTLKDKTKGHFYVWDKNNKMYNYFAKSGYIAGYHNKGIVTMCRKNIRQTKNSK